MIESILVILLTAIAPVALLMWWVNRKDSTRPEPKKMLVKGFFFGLVSVFLSLGFSLGINELGLSFADSTSLKGQIAEAFFGAALPEETAKLIMLWLLLRRNKYYDEYFDGIVYAACIGLGFAGFENIFYLVDEDEWFSVGVVRAFVSVPGHLSFAVAMGYFYSHCKFGVNKNLWTYICVLLIPVLAHWIFDALLMGASVVSDTMSLVFIVVFIFFLRFLYNRTMKRIHKLEDM